MKDEGWEHGSIVCMGVLSVLVVLDLPRDTVPGVQLSQQWCLREIRVPVTVKKFTEKFSEELQNYRGTNATISANDVI